MPTTATAKGDINVSDNPAVEGSMPAAPESKGREVIGHTTNHIFWGIDSIDKCPETEEPPWNEKFQPNDVQVEECQHTELTWCENRPIRRGL